MRVYLSIVVCLSWQLTLAITPITTTPPAESQHIWRRKYRYKALDAVDPPTIIEKPHTGADTTIQEQTTTVTAKEGKVKANTTTMIDKENRDKHKAINPERNMEVKTEENLSRDAILQQLLHNQTFSDITKDLNIDDLMSIYNDMKINEGSLKDVSTKDLVLNQLMPNHNLAEITKDLSVDDLMSIYKDMQSDNVTATTNDTNIEAAAPIISDTNLHNTNVNAVVPSKPEIVQQSMQSQLVNQPQSHPLFQTHNQPQPQSQPQLEHENKEDNMSINSKELAKQLLLSKLQESDDILTIANELSTEELLVILQELQGEDLTPLVDKLKHKDMLTVIRDVVKSKNLKGKEVIKFLKLLRGLNLPPTQHVHARDTNGATSNTSSETNAAIKRRHSTASSGKQSLKDHVDNFDADHLYDAENRPRGLYGPREYPRPRDYHDENHYYAPRDYYDERDYYVRSPEHSPDRKRPYYELREIDDRRSYYNQRDARPYHDDREYDDHYHSRNFRDIHMRIPPRRRYPSSHFEGRRYWRPRPLHYRNERPMPY